MRLHQLAHPFRVEQVGEALRRVLRLHQLGVVGDDAEQHPMRGEGAVGVEMSRRVVLGRVRRQVGSEPAFALPGQHVRGIRRVDDVDIEDARGILLRDAREDALRPRALDPDRDARKLRLEDLGVLLGHGDLHGRVEVHPAFLGRGLDQSGRDRLRRRGLRQDARCARRGPPPPRPLPAAPFAARCLAAPSKASLARLQTRLARGPSSPRSADHFHRYHVRIAAGAGRSNATRAGMSCAARKIA